MKKFLLLFGCCRTQVQGDSKTGFLRRHCVQEFRSFPLPSAYVGLHCRIIVGQKIQACFIASNGVLAQLDLV
jgi:hypothetical protein